MWTPIAISPGGLTSDKKNEGYGFGWFIKRNGAHIRVEHSGGWQGFTAYIARQIDKKMTVIVFSNLSTGPVSRIGKAILTEMGAD